MTTIAWDGKTLAADRGSWQCYIANKVKKLRDVSAGSRIVGQRYVALSGDAHICEAMCAWLLGGDLPQLPDADKNKSCGVVLAEGGRIFRMATGMTAFEEILIAPFADGGGAEIALGAMLAGASAVRAVEIVAERSSLLWGGVDAVTL